MKGNFFAFVALAAGLASAPAPANVITLAGVVGHLYQQTVQSPCIFENPSCQQGSFTGTELPTGGAVASYNAFSPLYSGATLLAKVGEGNSLFLGLDINQASGQPAQSLTLFEMLINGTVVDTYTGSTGNVPAVSNGNGFADYLLGNFSTFLATDTVQFHLVFSNANAGTENVFLVGRPGETALLPEPGTLALLGLAITGLALVRRRHVT